MATPTPPPSPHPPERLPPGGPLGLCRWNDCAGGCGASTSPGGQATALQRLKTDGAAMQQLRRLVHDESPGLPTHRLGDDGILAAVAALLDRGTWRLCPSVEADCGLPSGTGPAWGERLSPDQALLARLGPRQRGFVFEGQAWRIVSARAWPRLSREPRYTALPKARAARLLEHMADTFADLPAGERVALREAVPLLADPSQRQTDGTLMVLHAGTPAAAARRPDSGGPAVTPAQLARLRAREEHWLEIRLVDERARPMAGALYQVELPDRTMVQGRLDADGLARLDHIAAAGACRVSFPEIDGAEWRAA